jgi:hypothetical protein
MGLEGEVQRCCSRAWRHRRTHLVVVRANCHEKSCCRRGGPCGHEGDQRRDGHARHLMIVRVVWCVGLVLWRRRRSADASAHAAEQVADCVWLLVGGAEWSGAEAKRRREGFFCAFCEMNENPNQKNINAIRSSRHCPLALNRSLQRSVVDPDDLPRREGAFERRSEPPRVPPSSVSPARFRGRTDVAEACRPSPPAPALVDRRARTAQSPVHVGGVLACGL